MVGETTALKLWWIALIVSIIGYVWINPEWFLLLTVLMVFDVITWIGKRLALWHKDITSRKFLVWVMAKILVLSALLLFAWSIKVIGISTWISVSVIIWLFIAWELYSSLQNIHTIKTGKEETEYDVISIITSRLLSLMRTFIERSLDILEGKAKK